MQLHETAAERGRGSRGERRVRAFFRNESNSISEMKLPQVEIKIAKKKTAIV